MVRSRILPLALIFFIALPAFAIAVGPINEKLPLDKIGNRIAVFEDVITRSRAAGINTTGLEKISTRAKTVEGEYELADARNDSKNKSIAKQKIARLSNNFTEELLSIRAEQDKRDVERAAEISRKQVERSERRINDLRSRGLATEDYNAKLNQIKQQYQRGIGLYNSGSYREAEEELRIARQKSSELMGDLEPILSAQGVEL